MGVHCRPHDVLDGLAEVYRPKRGNDEAASVPLRYDWEGGGGFYLDYILKKNPKPEHKAWLASRSKGLFVAINNFLGSTQIKHFDIEQLRAMVATKDDKSELDVFEVVIGQFDTDYDIRGVKASLHKGKNKLTESNLIWSHWLLLRVSSMQIVKGSFKKN